MRRRLVAAGPEGTGSGVVTPATLADAGRPERVLGRASAALPGPRGTVSAVTSSRRCSRTACDRPAVLTLTYVYADQTAVVGPLATYAEPHSYDLCDVHGDRLSAPRGWEVMRLAPDPSTLPPSTDDLLALADAVREAGRPLEPGHAGPAGAGRQVVEATRSPGAGSRQPAGSGAGRETGRRGHLRMLTSD